MSGELRLANSGVAPLEHLWPPWQEQGVLALIHRSQALVEKAEAAIDGSLRSLKSLHKAEQVRPLVPLAAASGARRGELVAFTFSDLEGRVLTIERGVSGEQVGATKTKRTRRLTLDRTTVELWRASELTWRGRGEGTPFGAWIFSPDTDHRRRLTDSGMGHWFAELCVEAGLVAVSLHRLRHSVATFWSIGVNSSGPNSGLAIATPLRRCGTMPMRYL